ncbi:MAG: TRAP transporter TatT component family protein [Spirochaetes bacterium]|nr:TRAP transporter TatT component family protein [Spirochaetota bacterium]
MKKRLLPLVIAGFCALFISGCSINRMAMNAVANALTGEGGGEVFTGDADYQLVGDALPFAIKLYETLLAANPNHRGLIETTGSLFIMYANAFVQGPAEMLPVAMHEERLVALERARSLYLRGMDILLRGLELRAPGFTDAFNAGDLSGVLPRMRAQEVPLLYWAAAGGLSAFSINPFDLDLGLRISEFYSMIIRAYELDPNFNMGALDDFLMIFYGSVPEGMGGDRSRVDLHFQRAIEKSGGVLAGTFVAYAQVVAIPAQDYNVFREMLEKALAIDLEDSPSNRLVNVLAQRRARHLMENAHTLFIDWDDDWDDDWYDWD